MPLAPFLKVEKKGWGDPRCLLSTRGEVKTTSSSPSGDGGLRTFGKSQKSMPLAPFLKVEKK
ncbi:unnamed protein product, partial [Musa hybrid cultivar]